MAIKTTQLPGSVSVETTVISINHTLTNLAGPPPTKRLQVGVTYADDTYLVDSKGVKTQLLATGGCPRYAPFTEEEAKALYETPLESSAFPGLSTLGEILFASGDAAVTASLNAQAQAVANTPQP